MTSLPDTTTYAGQREASRMLFNLMGWETREILGELWTTVPGLMFDEEIQWADTVYPDLNLYAVSATGGEPIHMPLAWRVLNFAVASPTIGASFDVWWVNDLQVHQLRYVPAAAQRTWLDKILSMAIEAGMVQK